MPTLDDNAIRVMQVLDEHRALDGFQIAALGELSVTETMSALRQLAKNGLVSDHDTIGYDPIEAYQVYSLDTRALAEWLQARANAREAQPA
jgi:hypothetical protein